MAIDDLREICEKVQESEPDDGKGRESMERTERGS